MSALTSALHPASSNRRRRVRHKIQTPAYATFTAETQGAMLDLHEIVDISEDGIAIQCHSPLELDKQVNLCLDLADCAEHIYTTGQVVWSNESGRSGLRFSALPPVSVARLREWLFVNVMAGVANGDAEVAAFVGSRDSAPPRPNYTDTLAAVSAVQRQVESLGPNLSAALQLISDRVQTLVRASGAAIALADADPNFMVCRASSGSDAPPVGTPLHIGSGFSGECVKSGMQLRCDDTEVDVRVDRESCRALGIRSILAVPVRACDKSIGILEVFSDQPHRFFASDGSAMQRLAETVVASVNRAARAENLPPIEAPPAPVPFAPSPGSVLFASAPEPETKMESAENKMSGGISLPRSHLTILLCAAAAIFAVLGYTLAPILQSKFQNRGRESMQTVLASSRPPKSDSAGPSVETATFDQLHQMAEKGDPQAQNLLGMCYAKGEGVKLNEQEAMRWFIRAAEQGNVAAQSKLVTRYYSGRGVPQDFKQAYFWMVVARLGGDQTSQTLGPSVRARLTRPQVTTIELEADRWLQQHRPGAKPPAGH